MDRETYLYKFGHRNERPKRLEAGVLNPTILGEIRNYDTFDLNFRKNPLQQWTVVYDEKDLSSILVMDETEKKRFLLNKVYEQPMALRDRKEGDFEELRKIDEFNKKVLEPHVVEVIRRSNEIAGELAHTPGLEGWHAATMLTDSQGQRKQYLQPSGVIKSDEDLAAEIAEKQIQKEIQTARKQRNREEKKAKREAEKAYEEYANTVIDWSKFQINP